MNVVFFKSLCCMDLLWFRYKTRGITWNAWVWCLLACSIGSAVKNYIALYIGFPSGDKQNVTKFNVTKFNVTKINHFRYSGARGRQSGQ